MTGILAIPAIGILSIAFAGYLAFGILKMPSGSKKMQEIAAAIQEGAMAYLNKQYQVVSVFAVIITAILYFVLGKASAIGFFAGAAMSALAGYVGMSIS